MSDYTVNPISQVSENQQDYWEQAAEWGLLTPGAEDHATAATQAEVTNQTHSAERNYQAGLADLFHDSIVSAKEDSSSKLGWLAKQTDIFTPVRGTWRQYVPPVDQHLPALLETQHALKREEAALTKASAKHEEEERRIAAQRRRDLERGDLERELRHPDKARFRPARAKVAVANRIQHETKDSLGNSVAGVHHNPNDAIEKLSISISLASAA